MPNKYWLVLTPGGMKARRDGVTVPIVDLATGELVELRWSGPGGGSATAVGVGRTGRPVGEFSKKARRDMRWTWNALPWDEVGRLAMSDARSSRGQPQGREARPAGR